MKPETSYAKVIPMDKPVKSAAITDQQNISSF